MSHKRKVELVTVWTEQARVRVSQLSVPSGTGPRDLQDGDCSVVDLGMNIVNSLQLPPCTCGTREEQVKVSSSDLGAGRLLTQTTWSILTDERGGPPTPRFPFSTCSNKGSGEGTQGEKAN